MRRSARLCCSPNTAFYAAVNLSSYLPFGLLAMLAACAFRRSGLFHHGKEMNFGFDLLALWVFWQVGPFLPMLGNVFISEVVHRPFFALPPAPFDWGKRRGHADPVARAA